MLRQNTLFTQTKQKSVEILTASESTKRQLAHLQQRTGNAKCVSGIQLSHVSQTGSFARDSMIQDLSKESW